MDPPCILTDSCILFMHPHRCMKQASVRRQQSQPASVSRSSRRTCATCQRVLSLCCMQADKRILVRARRTPAALTTGSVLAQHVRVESCGRVSEEGVQVCSCLITVIMFTLCREACLRCFARLACAITDTRANCFADLGRVQRDTVHGYQVHDVSCRPRLHEPTIGQTSPRAL